jgi:hypothetical protein
VYDSSLSSSTFDVSSTDEPLVLLAVELPPFSQVTVLVIINEAQDITDSHDHAPVRKFVVYDKSGDMEFEFSLRSDKSAAKDNPLLADLRGDSYIGKPLLLEYVQSAVTSFDSLVPEILQTNRRSVVTYDPMHPATLELLQWAKSTE